MLWGPWGGTEANKPPIARDIKGAGAPGNATIHAPTVAHHHAAREPQPVVRGRALGGTAISKPSVAHRLSPLVRRKGLVPGGGAWARRVCQDTLIM